VPSSTRVYSQADLYRVIRSDLFARGPLPVSDSVGLELELFPIVFDQTLGQPVPARLGERGEGGPTLMGLFDRLIAGGGWKFVDEDGSTVLVRELGGRITLEPAGQIEYSGPPCACAAEALANLRDVAAQIEDAAREAGIDLLARGYNNVCVEESVSLQIKKERYRAMDSHFERIGPFGRKMMRVTCSLQINLDFGGPAITADRWRLANMIAPSLNAIFANSPHVHDGLPYRSFRHEIWRRTDPTRTGRLYDRPDLDPVADYLRFALDATVMMIRNDQSGAAPPTPPFTFRRWLSGLTSYGFPDWEDWRLHLTTLFPDVRARGWMELRSIDALPGEWWGVPVAMTTALLYNEGPRREALDLLERRERHVHPDDHEHGGLWRSDYETGVELLALALPAIEDPELAALAQRYYDEFCACGLVPADIAAAFSSSASP
jgi:glutamate--cysteine ligase